MSGMNWNVRRRGLLAALVGGPLAIWSGGAAQASPARGTSSRPGIPRGYEDVDPRTARRVPLWQELSVTNPIFPGDPPFTYKIFNTIAKDGYLLERITSLGTHTGTHVSAPGHFVEGAPKISQLDESWTLMPLVVLDVRERIAGAGGDFLLGVPELRQFEHRHGDIPAGGCVLMLTGFSSHYTTDVRPGPADDYFDPAPGFSAEAVAWLFESRRIRAVGADTFGPDATSDEEYTATATALQHGGITVENVGAGLAQMRPFGDWVSINGGRPRFSGFQMGITGFTLT
jgi:kynurenine formamidase